MTQLMIDLTISRLALNIFLKHYIKESRIPLIKGNIYDDLKKGYYGGVSGGGGRDPVTLLHIETVIIIFYYLFYLLQLLLILQYYYLYFLYLIHVSHPYKLVLDQPQVYLKHLIMFLKEKH